MLINCRISNICMGGVHHIYAACYCTYHIVYVFLKTCTYSRLLLSSVIAVLLCVDVGMWPKIFGGSVKWVLSSCFLCLRRSPAALSQPAITAEHDDLGQ